jgi:hypothetical protein
MIKGNDNLIYRLTCFGYQEGSSKTLIVILPDGGIVLTDDIEKIQVC